MAAKKIVRKVNNRPEAASTTAEMPKISKGILLPLLMYLVCLKLEIELHPKTRPIMEGTIPKTVRTMAVMIATSAGANVNMVRTYI